MNDFPFFSHWVIRLIFDKNIIINKILIEDLSKKMVKNLKLKVMRKIDYEFPKSGLTKVLILSQSHLIFHTWPEKQAIHLDLLTCSRIDSQKIANAWQGLAVRKEIIKELKY